MTDLANTDEAGNDYRSFPMRRQCPLSMPNEYAELRATEPISKVTMPLTGRTAWLLTRHEDVSKVLADKTMSSNAKHPNYPHQFPIPQEVLEFIKFPFAAMDPPEHTVRRRMVIPEFTAKRVNKLRPVMQQIADDQIDAMLEKGGPVDLVQELAAPVPSQMSVQLLGADAADIQKFRDYAAVTMSRDVGQEETNAAYLEMDEFLGRLIKEKEQEPGDDLLSRLVATNNEEKSLEHDDLVAIARLLVIAGFDTTTNMIALGTVMFLQNPEQLAELKADPSLMPKAVEELLRYTSIADATVRVATQDTEMSDGFVIREGEAVIALNGAANWDPAVFPEPEKFDIHRDAREQIAFSYGAHQCLGANLARMELEIAFNTLFRRIPNLRLNAPVDELPFMHGRHVYGLFELPVTW